MRTQREVKGSGLSRSSPASTMIGLPASRAVEEMNVYCLRPQPVVLFYGGLSREPRRRKEVIIKAMEDRGELRSRRQPAGKHCVE